MKNPNGMSVEERESAQEELLDREREWRSGRPSGLKPLPTDERFAGRMQSAEGVVRVEYRGVYVCELCGWRPQKEWGCIPAMVDHLRDMHGKTWEKPLWITSYCDSEIKELLSAPVEMAQPQQKLET